jgi:hypothetical protein
MAVCQHRWSEVVRDLSLKSTGLYGRLGEGGLSTVGPHGANALRRYCEATFRHARV